MFFQKEIDAIVKLLANFLEADVVSIYVEGEGEVFRPFSCFSINSKDVFNEFSLEDGGIFKEILLSWPAIWVNSDDKLLSAIPVSIKKPKVLMAIPFKLGSRRALLFATSNVSSKFTEKQQSIVKDFVEYVRKLFWKSRDIKSILIDSAKYKKLRETISILLGPGKLEEKFILWCQNMGIDAGFFFVNFSSGIKPLLFYRKKGIELPQNIEIGPRNVVSIAMEKGEAFIFDETEGEFIEKFASYGVAIPVGDMDKRGCLCALSFKKGFFARELEDILMDVALVIYYTYIKEGGEGKYEGLKGILEADKWLKIMTSRAEKEGIKLSIAVIKFVGYRKLEEKRGIWKAEEVVERFFQKLNYVFRYPDAVTVRMGERGVVVLKYSVDKKEDKAFRKELQETILKIQDSDEDLSEHRGFCDKVFFLYPDEVKSYESLQQKIGRELMSIKGKGRFLL